MSKKKLEQVTFYQAVRLPPGKHGGRSVNTIRPKEKEFAEINLDYDGEFVTVSHESWMVDLVVGLANVRAAFIEKPKKNVPCGTKTVKYPPKSVVAKMKRDKLETALIELFSDTKAILSPLTVDDLKARLNAYIEDAKNKQGA